MKPIIYQLLPRLFGNVNNRPVACGTLEQNGTGKMSQINDSVLQSLRGLGVTHVWYTGVIEHAHRPDYTAYGIPRHNPHVIKGEAGSPYAICDYYDIDPDIADDPARRMEEFASLVERTHNRGMKVIIDFVPNHVAREYHSDAAPQGVRDFGADDDSQKAFDPNNNFYYLPGQRFDPSNVYLGDYVEEPARASGNDCFTASPDRNDWFETVKLNYGVDYCGGGQTHFDPVPSTWRKMLHILRYWAAKGVDGFRCDMASMVPVEFWRWVIPQVKKLRPRVCFIAEIYELHLYRAFIDAGFDYLYDKVNLYDTLRAVERDETWANRITDCWQRVDGLGQHLLNFLENHDEQRYASPFYAGRADTVLPSLVVATMISTGPMMIYAGQELGETGTDAEGFSGYDGRTTIFDYWSMPTLRRWLASGVPSNALLTPEEVALRGLYSRVLNLANTEPAITAGLFFDLMYVNMENPTVMLHHHYIFMRHHGSHTLLIAVNFGSEAAAMEINIPRHAIDYLGLTEGEYPATELLTSRRSRKLLSSTIPFATTVPAHGAVVWRIDADTIVK